MGAHPLDLVVIVRAKLPLCVALCLMMGWALTQTAEPARAQSDGGGSFVIDESITFSDPEPAPAAPLDPNATLETHAPSEPVASDGDPAQIPTEGADDDPFAGLDCSPDAFATVVDSAGSTLRAMNAERGPHFQAMLRVLKSRRGWDDEAFIANARIYVEDDKITAYDETAAQLLAKINSLGGEGAGDVNAAEPDCELLAELEGHLEQLVQTIDAKWVYMFARVEAALSE